VGPQFLEWAAGLEKRGWPFMDRIWWSGRRDSLRHDYGELTADPVGFLTERGDAIPLFYEACCPGLDQFQSLYEVGVFGVPREIWFAARGYDEQVPTQ
jgi:hypothetical protein